MTVSALGPGLTRTEFHERGGSRADTTPSFLWQSAEAVAEAGLDGLDRSRAVVIPGAHNKVLSRAIKAAPLGLINRVRRRLSGPVR